MRVGNPAAMSAVLCSAVSEQRTGVAGPPRPAVFRPDTLVFKMSKSVPRRMGNGRTRSIKLHCCSYIQLSCEKRKRKLF